VEEVSTIGLDIAKSVFHAHGADATGRQLFSQRITRAKVLEFFAGQPRCLVVMEACGSSHHWARDLTELGHDVRLIPPAYGKPFVKRQKNDAADAEAICEAALRPNMCFVAVKSEEQQALGLVFRTRDLLGRQRNQMINAIRGHLAEYGWVAPRGPSCVTMLGELVEDELGASLPAAARGMFRIMLSLLEELDRRIGELDKEIARRARTDTVSRRLYDDPGDRTDRGDGDRRPGAGYGDLPARARLCSLARTHRGNTQPAARRSSGASRGWGIAPCDDC
jgi:transposase